MRDHSYTVCKDRSERLIVERGYTSGRTRGAVRSHVTDVRLGENYLANITCQQVHQAIVFELEKFLPRQPNPGQTHVSRPLVHCGLIDLKKE